MTITINDVSLNLPDGASISEALTAKEIDPKGKATALNGKVVPAVLRDTTVLKDGDKLVVIKAFYGG